MVDRKNLRLFGKDGDTTFFEQFGSKTLGSSVKTKDIEEIQSLDAWLGGIQEVLVSGNKAMFLQDMNALLYVLAYQTFYILQDGVPEWNTDTVYRTGSIVRREGTAEQYMSKADDNLGNPPATRANTSFWEYLQREVPPGIILDYVGGGTPQGYLYCDGGAVSRTVYADLFVAIGTTFGSGDGSTTFNLPNFRDRFALGSGPSFGSIGDFGGNSIAGPHLDTYGGTISAAVANLKTYANSGGGPLTSGEEFSGVGTIKAISSSVANFSIMPPYGVVNKIIKT